MRLIKWSNNSVFDGDFISGMEIIKGNKKRGNPWELIVCLRDSSFESINRCFPSFKEATDFMDAFLSQLLTDKIFIDYTELLESDKPESDPNPRPIYPPGA